MTTLELAEEIAMAVWVCCESAAMSASEQRAATQAVLRVLYENHSWFCKMDPNKAHEWPEEFEERYEFVQLDLFPSAGGPSNVRNC